MNTFVVIEEQQSMDGVSILSYEDYKSSNCQRTILFTGTVEECDQYRSQYTWDNPYYSNISDEVSIANREHVPVWQYDITTTVQENHKNFSEFCNSNGICLEDLVCYIYEENGVATQDVTTANEIEQLLYSKCLEECEFKPKKSKQETYTREEVYSITKKVITWMLNRVNENSNIDFCFSDKTVDEIINSEIDTVKLF